MEVRVSSSPTVELPSGPPADNSERVMPEQADSTEPAPASTDPTARDFFKNVYELIISFYSSYNIID
jgi:hypothetical protein